MTADWLPLVSLMVSWPSPLRLQVEAEAIDGAATSAVVVSAAPTRRRRGESGEFMPSRLRAGRRSRAGRTQV